MDLWSGLDVALHHDGGRGVARVARRGLENSNLAVELVSGSMAVQCTLDTSVLRGTPYWICLRRNCDALAGTRGDSGLLLSSQPAFWDIADSLSGLGQLRHSTEFYYVAFEPLNASRCKNPVFLHNR